MKKELQFLSRFSKYGFFNKSFFSTNVTVGNNEYKPNLAALLTEAEHLENSFQIKKAIQAYEKIIYETDPTCREAYSKLMNIWLTYSSAYGLKKDKLDRYLKQHDDYIQNINKDDIPKITKHT